MDGASDNKNAAFLQFMAYIVRTGLADIIKVSFLLVGHTHIDIDQKFVPITRELRKSIVISIHDLVDAAHAAYKTDKPTAIVVVQEVPDFAEWLKAVALPFGGAFNRRTADENRPHQFIFSSTGEGDCNLHYKNLAVDVTVWDQNPIKLLSATCTCASS